MRSLLFPLLLALAGFALLVALTYPGGLRGAPAPRSDGSAGGDGRAPGAAEVLDPPDRADARGESLPLVIGRLVDVDGTPLEHAAVAVAAVGGAGHLTPLPTEVGAGGAFVVRRDPSVPGGDVELRLWSRDARGAVERFANLEVELTRDATAAVGDVVLGPLPTLVAGIVRDPGGDPVAGARLEVLEAVHGSPGAPLEYLPAPSPYPLDGTTDEDGGFRLRGLPKGHALVLQVRGPASGDPGEWLSTGTTPRPFAPRDEALQVLLGPPATVALDLTLSAQGTPVDLGWARVWVSAWPAGARRSEELAPYVPSAATDAGGRATFDALAPGAWDLSIHLASPANPAAHVWERVVVPPGTRGRRSTGRPDGRGRGAQDPRTEAAGAGVARADGGAAVGPAEVGAPSASETGGGPSASAPDLRLTLDLDELRIFRIHAVDEAGATLRARFEHRLPGTTTWLPATPTSADPERPGIVSAWPALDLRVSAAGHEAAVLEAVDGDRSVTLHARD